MAKNEKIAERVPPQNIEAEQSLLGSLLIDKNAIIKVADKINSDDFYKKIHYHIYEAMVELYLKQEPIDILSLTNKLKEGKKLEEIGGRSYLAQLSTLVPTSSHVLQYAKIVQKKATLRRLIEASSDILESAYGEKDEIERIMDLAEKKLFNVSQKYSKQIFVPIKNLLTEAFDRIDELHRESGKLRGLPTGLPEMDNLLGGFQKSDLIILAARPSIGKTAFALDFARHAATKEKQGVGIFSLEMSKESIVDRLLCAEANVDLWKLRTGKLSDREEEDDFTRIGHAMGILAESPIFIDDTATSNVMEIKTKARRLQMEHGLGMIIIDYLQLMESASGAESRVQAVADITRGLKAVARELNVPVLVLSQLSRGPEARTPAIPRLADLRESGSIEQDADVVVFIYRKSKDKSYTEVPPEEKNIAEILISKHRNGPTGTVKLFFDESRTSFRSLEKQVDETEAPPPF